MNKNKYYTIYEWMINKLNLRNGELVIYALIYSICSSNEKCYPSQQYISNESGLSIRSVRRITNSLADKNLITISKIDKGKNYVYKVNYIEEIMSPVERTKCPLTEDKMSANNKVYNRVNKTPLDTEWGYIY